MSAELGVVLAAKVGATGEVKDCVGILFPEPCAADREIA